jgi:hypothetical protein
LDNFSTHTREIFGRDKSASDGQGQGLGLGLGLGQRRWQKGKDKDKEVHLTLTGLLLDVLPSLLTPHERISHILYRKFSSSIVIMDIKRILLSLKEFDLSNTGC